MKNEITNILSIVDTYSNLDDCYVELENDLKDTYSEHICIKKSDLINEINKWFNTTEDECKEFYNKLGINIK